MTLPDRIPKDIVKWIHGEATLHDLVVLTEIVRRQLRFKKELEYMAKKQIKEVDNQWEKTP